jgi:exosome complex component RRP4
MQVQAISRSDGNVALHMRGSKYGKLRYGQLVVIPSKLVRRRGSHFVAIDDTGVQLIMGCNGWIFVGLTNKEDAKKPQQRAMPFGATSSPDEWVDFTPTADQWQLCARYAAAIQCAAKLGVPARVEWLKEIVRVSAEQGVSGIRMLQMDFLSLVLQLEEERRRSTVDTMDVD